MTKAMPDFGAGIEISHIYESEVHRDDFGRGLHNVPWGAFLKVFPREHL
jgi:hypothetical protein